MGIANASASVEAKQGYNLSTMGGVFTPSILTILGVILFMRSNMVVGEAGIGGAVAILVICSSITLITALSISAISTNTPVRGGGAYFLISRVLGPEFGGAIGIALFLAQAVSVPFYILGFSEALVYSFPALKSYFLIITLGTFSLLFCVAFLGANWAVRAQFGIMVILGLSILTFLTGSLSQFSMATFQENLVSASAAPNVEALPGPRLSFWVLLALYFPAVTGILAGVNLSGDLKDPAKAIPKGILAAIGVATLIYLLQMITSGGAYSRADLLERPFELLTDNAFLGARFLVIAGVSAATLSSALGSILAAPRVLQAVSRDRIIRLLNLFGQGRRRGDDPVIAMVLTGLISVAILLWAGNATGGQALNVVASVITMFFLYTYGMTNLAAFMEAYGDNPSFRPRFRFFHWSTALLGALACVAVALLIHWVAALVACGMIFALVRYINSRELTVAFGDARRGFIFSEVRRQLLRLVSYPEDSKNWRPTIIVFSGNPDAREHLVRFSVLLEAGRGIVLLANILKGNRGSCNKQWREAYDQLQSFCRTKRIHAFPVVLESSTIEAGVSTLMQTASVGSIRPNMAMFGWAGNPELAGNLARNLRLASSLGISQVVLMGQGDASGFAVPEKRIDVWWRGRKNGGLMLLLAHLMTRNREWYGTTIRVVRLISSGDDREDAEHALKHLVNRARVEAQCHVVVEKAFGPDLLKRISGDATCVFLGFQPPGEDNVNQWFSRYAHLLHIMPAVVMVCSEGVEDPLA